MKTIVNMTLVLVATISLSANALAAEITLKESAEARYLFVTFSDLAAVTGMTEEETGRINDIFCGPAPNPGEVREVTVDYIKMRLRQSGFDPKSFKFSGAEAVQLKTVVVVDLPISEAMAEDNEPEEVAPKVEPEPVPVAAPIPFQDKLKSAIFGYAAERLEANPADISVSVKNVGKALENCDDSTEITELKSARPLATLGNVSFSVAVKTGGREARFLVSADITVSMAVVIAMQDIAAGTMIEDGMLVLQRVPVTSPSDYFLSAKALDGFKAAANITAGQAVTVALVEQPALVKRGDIVKVRVRVAGTDVLVEASARAEKDGHKGEYINVTNVNSKETFSAQVIGQGQVQVIVGGQ
jgi:flagella basal body P-ring formation protein FlgA